MKHRILDYQIDDPDASFKFSDRLAQENLWSLDYAKKVIEEYKKFMYLGANYGKVTPSLDVDECWHLHMIYTEDYWINFCKNTIGMAFQHGPTKGGWIEDVRFREQYDKTLGYYRMAFGEPPADIWPPAEERFKPVQRVRVDLSKHWVIPVGDFKAVFKALKYYFKSKF
jgi:hypothetical protein